MTERKRFIQATNTRAIAPEVHGHDPAAVAQQTATSDPLPAKPEP
jgi:hypothetical protein